ncbi:hypothetical protein MMC17_001721 [Xylographa soralifera]|nr:hypothetical protein [Xylographa soralifera]
MASPGQKHKQLSPEAEIAFMEFCGIRTFLRRVLDNDTQPDDDVNAFFARLHEELPFYIAPNPIFYDLLDIMQELMDEGLPKNPLSVEAWAELKDALEAQDRPVIPDTMSETGDPEVDIPLGLVPLAGKWSSTEQVDLDAAADDAAEDADLDAVKLMEITDRLARGFLSLPDPQKPEVSDNLERNKQEESSKTRGTGTGLYDSSEEDAVDSPKVQLPKLEMIESGTTAIALTSVEAQSKEPLKQTTFVLDPALPASSSHEPQQNDHTEPSPPKSLLDPAVPAFVPSNPPQNSPQSEIELLKEHISSLSVQLTHLQIDRTTDTARMQSLERAQWPSRRSGTGEVFRCLVASAARGYPRRDGSSRVAANAALLGIFAQARAGVERGGVVDWGIGAQEGRGYEGQGMVEEEEEGDEVLRVFGALGVNESRQVLGLPSWVPDWSVLGQSDPVQAVSAFDVVTVQITHYRKFRASFFHLHKPRPTTDANQLITAGRVIDRIQGGIHRLSEVQNSSPHDLPFHGLEAALLQFLPLFAKDYQRPAEKCGERHDESLDKVRILLVQTLTALYSRGGDVEENEVAQENLESLRHAAPEMLDAFAYSVVRGDKTQERPLELQDWLTQLAGHSKACFDRTLVELAKYRLGLCPRDCRQGDLVCILHGSNVPVLLRPQGNYYEVVGQCYVHGIMEGEAVDWEEHEADLFTLI